MPRDEGRIPRKEGCQGRKDNRKGRMPRKERYQRKDDVKEGRIPRKEGCQGRKYAKEEGRILRRVIKDGYREGCDENQVKNLWEVNGAPWLCGVTRVM
jgi:hypothetical protein